MWIEQQKMDCYHNFLYIYSYFKVKLIGFLVTIFFFPYLLSCRLIQNGWQSKVTQENIK